MPIYAYKCEQCGRPHEALQKIADAQLTVCPHCGAAALVKQVTAAGFQLKGSGWYVTDFRDGGKKEGKPAADGDAKAAESKAGDAAKGDAVKPDSTAPAPAVASPAAAPAPAPAPPAKTGGTD